MADNYRFAYLKHCVQKQLVLPRSCGIIIGWWFILRDSLSLCNLNYFMTTTFLERGTD